MRKGRRLKEEDGRTAASVSVPSSFLPLPSSSRGSPRPPGAGRGAKRSHGWWCDRHRARRPEVNGYPGGFTLLEMIIVLVIIAILAAASIPAFNSAVNEHTVREDGHELAMMVRTAMIQSAEQQRTYVIDLTKGGMSLHAQGENTQAQDNTDNSLFQDSGNNQAADSVTPTVRAPNVDAGQQLDSDNKLKLPDPDKTDGWIDPPDGSEWVFEPGQLCPATKVRIVRGDAYLELDFAALTGDIDTEKYYFP